ncbi:MAG: ATP-binding protein [Agathobacter sp.]|nr:ATP-binding protein [Agathobacter sp.]
MIKAQICCMIIVMFIAAVYFKAKRVKSYSHIIFSISLVICMFNLLFDMITVYTVNHLESVPSSVNRIAHNLFLGSLIAEVFMFYLYSSILIYEDKINKKRLWLAAVPVWIAWLGLVTLPIEYVETPKGNYSWGPAVLTVHGIVVFYIACIVIRIIRHRKEINPKKGYVIRIAFLVQIIVLVYQSFNPTALISGIATTLINLAFFLTVESPDVLLMENLREERKRADEANEAKSMFLSNMSHEIRTPMNAIVGMTDILLREELPETAREYLNNIKNSGDALLTIINDILDFSKIESGKLEIVEQEYEPMSVFHDLSMIFLNRIGEKPVELLYDITPDMPVSLYGDSQRLRQIIINLVNNAIKFTESGYVRLKAEIENIGNDKVKLIFSVEDTGQGIKEEDIDRLFASFSQVNTKENYKKEGTGLGLAISKQLVELMHGEIGVESTYGKGSIFSFYVIHKIVDANPAAYIKKTLDNSFRIGYHIENGEVREQLTKLADMYGVECVEIDGSNDKEVAYLVTDMLLNVPKEEKEKVRKNGGRVCVLHNPMIDSIHSTNVIVINKPLYSLNFCQLINHEAQVYSKMTTRIQRFTAPQANILVVDDNKMNLKVAEGLLAPYKMNIDTASDGKQALEMVQEKNYNIVFMDHMMPVMDGIEATQKIRSLEGDYYQNLPIVALSANATSEAREMFIQANMSDFVAKPIREKELDACVRKWLPDELMIVSEEQIKEATGTQDLPEIEGLDVEEAIKNCGSPELFRELLGDFYMLIDSKSAKIEQFLEENMLRDFTIEVHALKNNARMIGAMELSQLFYKMEQLGNEEKKQEIEQGMPELLKLYRSYKEILSEYAKPADENKQQVSTETIKKTLMALHDAVDSFDLDAADDAMKELETYELPEEMKPLVEQLRIYVTDVAMEDILELTQKMYELC